MHKIVILGAGYAGMITAATLVGRTKKRDDVQITVVNASDRFTERLRLHQLASGQELAQLSIPAMLPEVEFIQGWVTGVDPDARTVRVDDERVVEYDTHGVPGVDDHAYTLDSAHNAELLAHRLATMTNGTVAVVGSGLTGLEAA